VGWCDEQPLSNTNLAGSRQLPLSNNTWLGLTKGCPLIQNLAGSD
jgi:hypothetical protein